jgi:hypothetical protein
MYRVRYFLAHTNSDSAKREKESVTFAIHVRTMWCKEKVSIFEIVHEEKASNFEIAFFGTH